LEHEINLHIKVITKLNETDYEMSCTAATRGRQKPAFEDSSEKIKCRRSKEILKTVGSTKLAHANKMSPRSAGKMDAAGLFSEALETTPKTGLIIRKAWNTLAKNIVVPYTPERLCLFTEAHLTGS
jgi:hypothetical protein